MTKLSRRMTLCTQHGPKNTYIQRKWRGKYRTGNVPNLAAVSGFWYVKKKSTETYTILVLFEVCEFPCTRTKPDGHGTRAESGEPPRRRASAGARDDDGRANVLAVLHGRVLLRPVCVVPARGLAQTASTAEQAACRCQAGNRSAPNPGPAWFRALQQPGLERVHCLVEPCPACRPLPSCPPRRAATACPRLWRSSAHTCCGGLVSKH